MSEPSLMVVAAHPDDEAFGVSGTMHRIVAQTGRVALVCATRGDAGEIADPSLATPETLGAVREAELRAACAIIGVDDLTILGYRDGRVAEADQEELVRRLVREVRRFRPLVIATFEANGGYGHRDHMAMHRVTLKAFQAAGDPDRYPEVAADDLKPFQADRLLGFAFPRARMQQLQESTGGRFRPGGDAATIPLEEMGTPDEDVAFAVRLDPEELERKLRVLHAHRTQMAPNNPITSGDPALTERWLGTESFSQLLPPRPAGAPVQSDIFAGIASPA